MDLLKSVPLLQRLRPAACLLVCTSSLLASPTTSLTETPSPLELWKHFDPDEGDFNEELVKETTAEGISTRDSYISAYVLGEEIRVYCRYAVKTGARNAPGLLNVHGWMGAPAIERDYVKNGWAVMAHDYCGERLELSPVDTAQATMPDLLLQNGSVQLQEAARQWGSGAT